jgi:hypothetical protein
MAKSPTETARDYTHFAQRTPANSLIKLDNGDSTRESPSSLGRFGKLNKPIEPQWPSGSNIGHRADTFATFVRKWEEFGPIMA